MSVSRRRLVAVNICGVFGYLSCTLQWLWVGVLFLPALIANPSIKDFILPQSSGHRQQIQSVAISGSTVAMTVIAIVITLVILVITVLVLVRLPMKIAKGGKKTVDSVTHVLLPVVSAHKKLPAKKKRRLTALLTKAVKMAICILPVAFLGLLLVIPVDIDPNIGLAVGCVLAIGSIIWFSLEYIVGRLFKIPVESII